MGPESAKKLDEYFGKSFKRFEEAIKNEYEFNQIEGISASLNNKIYDWYYSEKEQAIWKPLIGELKFRGDTATAKRKYFNGDKAKMQEVELKAKIIGYARMLRRTVRRVGKDTEEGKGLIELCQKHLAELIPLVDSLDF